MKTQDEVLIAQFLSGDTAGFEALVRKYRDKSVAIAYRIVQNKEEAADVSQEAFMKVFKSLKNFTGKSCFYTWLYRIVTNLAIDHKRRFKKVIEFREELKTDDEDTDPGYVIKDTDPRKEALDQELERRINQAIDSLPEHHRTTVLLRDKEDFSYEEIAEIMECSIGTVMSRLHYAREKLQKKLERYLGR